MSQGKRTANGICDYCLNRIAYSLLADGSEICVRCDKELRADWPEPKIVKPKRKKRPTPKQL